jgi:hypothetical protein
MRIAKALGLLAIAVLAAMACLATPAAMAENTLLCNKDTVALSPTTAECEPTKHVHFLSVVKNEAGQHVDGKIKRLDASSTVECELLALGDVEEPFLANPVRISVKLTYTACNLGCKITAPGGASEIPGIWDILRLGNEELADVTSLNFALVVTCPFVFVCDYNSENLVGHGLPLNNEHGGLPHITYEKASVNLVQKLSGPFNCPTTSVLDALLESLTHFYLRA